MPNFRFSHLPLTLLILYGCEADTTLPKTYFSCEPLNDCISNCDSGSYNYCRSKCETQASDIVAITYGLYESCLQAGCYSESSSGNCSSCSDFYADCTGRTPDPRWGTSPASQSPPPSSNNDNNSDGSVSAGQSSGSSGNSSSGSGSATEPDPEPEPVSELTFSEISFVNDDDGSGVLSAGETATLRFQIRNLGPRNVLGLRGTLTATGAFVKFNEPNGGFCGGRLNRSSLDLVFNHPNPNEVRCRVGSECDDYLAVCGEGCCGSPEIVVSPGVNERDVGFVFELRDNSGNEYCLTFHYRIGAGPVGRLGYECGALSGDSASDDSSAAEGGSSSSSSPGGIDGLGDACSSYDLCSSELFCVNHDDDSYCVAECPAGGCPSGWYCHEVGLAASGDLVGKSICLRDGDSGSSNSSGSSDGMTGSCTNTCRFADDNECDDGGDGSVTSACNLGTDCNDCGPR